MRWFRSDRSVGIMALIVVVAALYAWLLSLAMDTNALAELFGFVQLLWWGLCQLGGLAVVILLFRLFRRLRPA